MTTKSNFTNQISKTKNILLKLSNDNNGSKDLDYLLENFSGRVLESISEIKDRENKKVYVFGDMKKIENEKGDFFVIEEFSSHYKTMNKENFHSVSLGEVPISIHGMGVLYRKFFQGSDYFSKIKTEHEFQSLSESNKQSMAFRKGIYLTKVKKEEHSETLHFHLLRCSSNLTGATENFRKTDEHIVNSVNEAVKYDFEEETDLNHVLAQIYENIKQNGREIKAKIKAHSDKTKDMPKNGVMAFCTFYDDSNINKLQTSQTDRFDSCYKQTSGFTKLHFKLKDVVDDDSLVKEFSVTLYPNSVFLMPLSTNRLYTHAIKPSMLNIDRIPIRMGYVIRCSNMEAVYMNEQTYIKENDKLIKLEAMTNKSMEDLRESYYEENKTEKVVEYGKVHFSMNLGDYEKPII